MNTGRGVIYKKVIVEDCFRVSVFDLNRKGYFKEHKGGAAYFNYSYAIGKESIENNILFTSTPCFFGGFRIWFACPSCARRVGVLYRPYFAKLYLCRHCYALSYYDRQLRRSIFEFAWRILRGRKRLKQILEGVGQKGFSKIEQIQIRKLGIRLDKVCPEFLELCEGKK